MFLLLIVLNNTFHHFVTKRHGEENCRGIEIYWCGLMRIAVLCNCPWIYVLLRWSRKRCLWEKTGGGWWVCVCVCVALVSFSSPSTAHTEATESRSLLNSTAPKQRLTHRQWRVFSTDNCCGLSSELACRLGPDTYSPHYTHKHRHAFRSEQTKKKKKQHIHAGMFKSPRSCAIILTSTHTQTQTLILQTLVSNR